MLPLMAFVGRERELALLAESVQRAASGRHGRVLLVGAPGVGCTSLIDELERRLSGLSGIAVCRGRGREPQTGVAYQALGEALAGALARLEPGVLAEVVGRTGHDISGVVPGLADRLDELGIDRAPPSLRAPDQLGMRVVEAVMGVLERLAGRGVVLLALEDLHWADPATRSFVMTLLGMARRLPVALALTYQPEELHRRHPMRTLAAALRDDPDTVRLEIGPLPVFDIERIVEAFRGERPPGSIMSAIAEGAQGNPLAALQLAEAATALEGIPLSDPFEQLTAGRLEALPGGAAQVVRLLAAARLPLQRATLLSREWPEGRVTLQAVAAALESGLAIETGLGLSAAHDLYAEAVESLELPLKLQALHAALAARPGVEPAVAAWHWSKAARPAEARVAHLEAASRYAMVDPGETTLLHLLGALELPAGDGAVRVVDRSHLLVDAAQASAASGSPRRAAALMRHAISERLLGARARAAGMRDAAVRAELADLHAQLARQEWAGGDLDTAIATLQKAETLAPADALRVRARILAWLAQYLMIDGRFEESKAVAERGLAAAEASLAAGEDALAQKGHLVCTLGVNVGNMGELDRGLTLLGEAAAIARRAGRLDDLMRVAANRTTLLDLDARREQALQVVEEGIRDATAGGLRGTYGAFLRGNAADILFQLGRWPEAERECRAAMEWRPAGLAWFSPVLYLGLLLAESRADEEAASLVGQALLQLENMPAGQLAALLQRAAVSLSLWRGQASDALSIVKRDWSRMLETGEAAQIALAASTSLEAAAAAAAQGQREHDWGLVASARDLADRVIRDAEARLSQGGPSPELGARQEIELHLATARQHLARLRGTVRPEGWASLAEAWLARSMPYLAAKARWWQALTILETGALGEGPGEAEREAARAAAQEPLAEAFELARALPALPLLREIVDLSVRARVPLPATGEAPALISERELVAVGPGPIVARGEDPGFEVARLIETRILAGLRAGAGSAYGLTPRENEVLRILSEGRSDRDIAALLFISERTVHVHVRRILAKLGVSSRTEATGLALRQGLVPIDGPIGASGARPSDAVASGS